jgi:ElaB/YqjD/DUF883 family membrane-anchored ribosome-binding protein
MLPKLLGDIFATEYAKLKRGSIRLALIISILGLAVMAAVIGMIFVLSGLYVSLAETMKPWEAGVVVGGGVIFFATILIVIIARQGRVISPKGNPISEQSSLASLVPSVKNQVDKQSEKIVDLDEDAKEIIRNETKATGESVKKYIKERPITSALIAFGSGFVVSILLRNKR